MQELNQYKDLPNTIEEDEAFGQLEAMAKLGGGVDLKEMFTHMGNDLTGNNIVFHDLKTVGEGKSAVFSTLDEVRALGETIARNTRIEAEAGTFDAPNPQPTLCESTQTPTLTDIINNICTQLQLLTTVIGEQARNTTPPEGNPPNLQETIELVLQQSDWFATMVEKEVNDLDLSDQIETHVERYCENYFSYNFDPRDHFDIDEAVADQVDDKIDQAVENYMDNATLTITRG